MFAIMIIRRQTYFADTMYLWILLNRIIGFWPYNLGPFPIKSKYYYILALQCFSIFVVLEYSFSSLMRQNVGKQNYFSIIFEYFNRTLIFIWVILGLANNDRLAQLINMLDDFDNLLKKLMNRSIPLTKFYEFRRVQFLIVMFAFDFLYFTFLMLELHKQRMLTAFTLSGIRLGRRWGHIFFLILYCHILESLRLRFDAIKTVWREIIASKIHIPFLHSRISTKMNEIQVLYHRLLYIVDGVNTSLGSRLCILHTMMFCNSLIYFYMMCNGNKPGITLLSYGVIIVILVIFTTWSMISSVSDFVF